MPYNVADRGQWLAPGRKEYRGSVHCIGGLCSCVTGGATGDYAAAKRRDIYRMMITQMPPPTNERDQQRNLQVLQTDCVPLASRTPVEPARTTTTRDALLAKNCVDTANVKARETASKLRGESEPDHYRTGMPPNDAAIATTREDPTV